MSAIKFPDEPIRFPQSLPSDGHFDADFDDSGRAECWTCGGDGVIVCNGDIDCPEADDAGCPFTDFHTYRCSECGGRGYFEVNLGPAL